jgi:hypothetical protein
MISRQSRERFLFSKMKEEGQQIRYQNGRFVPDEQGKATRNRAHSNVIFPSLDNTAFMRHILGGCP